MTSRLDEIRQKKTFLEPDAEAYIDFLLSELERKDKALRFVEKEAGRLALWELRNAAREALAPAEEETTC